MTDLPVPNHAVYCFGTKSLPSDVYNVKAVFRSSIFKEGELLPFGLQRACQELEAKENENGGEASIVRYIKINPRAHAGREGKVFFASEEGKLSAQFTARLPVDRFIKLRTSGFRMSYNMVHDNLCSSLFIPVGFVTLTVMAESVHPKLHTFLMSSIRARVADLYHFSSFCDPADLAVSAHAQGHFPWIDNPL